MFKVEAIEEVDECDDVDEGNININTGILG